MLGTKPDGDLARRLGVSYKVVRYNRVRLGITGVGAKNQPGKWKPAWDKLLGKQIDRDLAERLGVARVTVAMHRQLEGIRPAVRHRLLEGVSSDVLASGTCEAVAKTLHCSAVAVGRERKTRHLKVPRTTHIDEARHAAVRGILKTFKGRWGVKAEIGRVLGVSRQRAHQLCAEIRAADRRAA
jgi:hypothetical protein